MENRPEMMLRGDGYASSSEVMPRAFSMPRGRGAIATRPHRPSAGPGYVVTYLLALPVLVVAMASGGIAQAVSGAIALTWLLWAPIALYAHWAAILLVVTSAAFFVLTMTLLPFNSAAFAVDLTATLMMFLVAFPRARSYASVS